MSIDFPFEMANEVPNAIIKVIGVGGCGCNAVDHMIRNGVQGVEFICANTDAQALARSLAPVQLQLGMTLTNGLGAGANPQVGRDAALEDRDQLADIIRGADMLFITAGMGGGTGTGAAPIVAEIAKELGVLTVAVVTKPFEFEGKRAKAAKEGLDALSQYVDSLIIIPNEKLMQVLGEDVSFKDAMGAANNVLNSAVAGIAEVINIPGMINVDFADVKTVMTAMGRAMMGSAVSSGVDRARIAAEEAIACPLLEDVSLSGARGILVNITAGASLKMREVHEVMDTIKPRAAEDAVVIYGTVIDEAMGEDFRVTLVATGLESHLNQAPKMELLQPVMRTGTDDQMVDGGESAYDLYDMPSVFRNGRRTPRASSLGQPVRQGLDQTDIPTFLRRQAD